MRGIRTRGAVIIPNIVTKKIPYQPSRGHLFLDQRRKLRIVAWIGKRINWLNITKEELGLVSRRFEKISWTLVRIYNQEGV